MSLSPSQGPVSVRLAPGTKCARCWRVLPEVGSWPDYPDLCLRCADAVLVRDTGLDLHHHAAARWDRAYRQAIAQGASPAEAEAQASV